MTEKTVYRLQKVCKELNIGLQTAVDFLAKKGIEIKKDPNEKLNEDIHIFLMKEFKPDFDAKMESSQVIIPSNEKQTITLENLQRKPAETPEQQDEEIMIKDQSVKLPGPTVKGKINLDEINRPKKVVKAPEPAPVVKEEIPEVKPEPVEVIKEIVKEPVVIPPIKKEEVVVERIKTDKPSFKIVDKINLDEIKPKKAEPVQEQPVEEVIPEEPVAKVIPEPTPEPETEPEVTAEKPVEEKSADDNFIKTNYQKIDGPKILGNIILEEKKVVKSNNDKFRKDRKDDKSRPHGDKKPGGAAPAAGTPAANDAAKHKRKRISPEKLTNNTVVPGAKPNAETAKTGPKWKKKKKGSSSEVDLQEVDENIKQVKAFLGTKEKSKTSRYKRDKRDAFHQKQQDEQDRIDGERNIIKITEFLTVNELATLMSTPVNQVIQKCMDVGQFVSINQRLDAEMVSLIADEFGFKVEFTSDEEENKIITEEDKPEDLEHRPPIVTVMGHVDHGKTKLLDFIRSSNVVAGEAGGITQHIGAYNVSLEDGRKITFLDTPGHEAFTAMRARGAKVTDVAIIVIAADDGIMPQTIEAINHAQAAGVKIVFAINKIDKPEANPDRIKEQLAQMNLLVEDWGGTYQSQEIAAKQGLNVKELLEKVLLEAEMLDLKANPHKKAIGTVLESSLDKGRGYVATALIHAGTLKIGDIIVAGPNYGRVKAMYNERNQKITEAGPSMPVQILGLQGAPQAGDSLNSMVDEHDAKEIANKRTQIIREQGLRTQKHITLEEIGRRIAIGNFKELNVIVKGDVDGSIEALSDSIIKLSNEEIVVNVIHKAVGQISDSDVMLAAASNAVIIGFQVRPSTSARKLAEKEEIQIKLYSVIYDAIEEIKQAMEGMLSPIIKEEILGTAEVRETFNIGKLGTIAGCMVVDGKIIRSAKVRLIRDGIVAFTGNLGSLKRFKDDAKEVTSGLECGLNIDGFNDIQNGDVIESFTEKEEKKRL
ncbi:MAG: translation initiation factor IF-2 [Bacteroidetes bacterium HGW-Bacteroidetes-21]|jgi:translation initiation factor IF-2|nr:MAG: translation initiation factor IF-2 [Bacteroidetes bacterium HGW-Bacteroidetes-21]